jgi:hypothetical protein
MPWATFDAIVAGELWLRNLDDASWGKADYVAPPPSKLLGQADAHEPLDPAAIYGTPRGVIIAAHDHGAVVLNMPAEKYQRLTPDAVRLVKALRDAGSVAGAHALLAAQYVQIAPDTLRLAVEKDLRGLEKLGILAEGITEHTLLESEPQDKDDLPLQMVPEPEHTPRVRLRDYAAALGGFALARVLKRKAPFMRGMERMDRVRGSLAVRSASAQEATSVLAAAHRVSRGRLARMACVELSEATVLGLALQRRSAKLVIGMRTDPESFHAWPQTDDGVPIRTDADEQISGARRPLKVL